MGNFGTKPDKDTLNGLHKIPLTLWSTQDVVTFLGALGIDSEITKKLEQQVKLYMLDGNGLLALGFPFFNKPDQTLEKDWNGVQKVFDLEWEFYIKNNQEEILFIKKTESASTQSFPPYEDIQDPLEFTLFYQRVTWNEENGKAARSLNRNWANQPHVCSRYYGSKFHPLEIPNVTQTPEYNALFQGDLPPQPLNSKSISQFLFFSLATSGRKDPTSIAMYPKSSWSKRCNASSGGLHPVECHFLFPPNWFQVDSKSWSIYHYSPKEHGLECRGDLQGAQTLFQILPNGFFGCLTSTNWREIWKYGERAFRYCQLDVGHAYGSLVLSALLQGWRMIPINVPHSILCQLFNLDKGENGRSSQEDPGIFFYVFPRNSEIQYQQIVKFFKELESNISKYQFEWFGTKSENSVSYVSWPIVEKITEITQVRSGPDPNRQTIHEVPLKPPSVPEDWNPPNINSGNVIRTRRSALDYFDYMNMKINPPPKIKKQVFLGMMAKLLPSLNPTFWNNFNMEVTANVAIYVVDVEGMTPGYYILLRDPKKLEHIKNKMKEPEQFSWQQVHDILPLYLLKDEKGEIAKISNKYSCFQPIALHCSYHLSFFTELHQLLQTHQDPSIYKQVNWEAGIIGSLLYIEAHARGFGATGMGCFMDDVALSPFGFRNGYELDEKKESETYKLLPNKGDTNAVTPLYHFTVGVPQQDERYPPYDYSTAMVEYVRDYFD
eukprot:TRINITY_DN14743_c0_g1_i1.p1 TRINITY_DN14743_c0_g1~~TRINITY_DN14743_c0_g1_i1.p1  ORF type:complete len:719 (+),score=206.46 TRINITY_DN14743_c0_g1_i1:16-2172(+)